MTAIPLSPTRYHEYQLRPSEWRALRTWSRDPWRDYVEVIEGIGVLAPAVQRAVDAMWRALGRRYRFRWYTARPSPAHPANPEYFLAEPHNG